MALICDKCGGIIIDGSKFCPHCGDVVDCDDKEAKAINAGEEYARLEFGYSSSQNYDKAVAICKNISTYSESGSGKNIRHSVTIPTTEIDLLINLYDLIGNWKNSKMLINGRACTKKDLTYYGLGCFKTMREAPNKANYCYGVFNDIERNIWGCKKLEMPIYPWGGGWLSYGAFDKNGVWHFNKKAIKEELEIKIKKFELCPILNKTEIFKTLDLLPDTINPKIDKNWDYVYTVALLDGEYKDMIAGIKPAKQEFSYFIPDGVENPQWNYKKEMETHHYESNNNQNYNADIIIQSAPHKKSSPILKLLLFVFIAFVLFKIIFK